MKKAKEMESNQNALLKIQANKIEVYEEKFTFSHMLDDVTTYLASNFSERNTELVFEISAEVPRYLTGDVMHFSSIINNLLEYAIHVTLQGKVTLKITSDDAVGDNIILNIEVKDGSKGLT